MDDGANRGGFAFGCNNFLMSSLISVRLESPSRGNHGSANRGPNVSWIVRMGRTNSLHLGLLSDVTIESSTLKALSK